MERKQSADSLPNGTLEALLVQHRGARVTPHRSIHLQHEGNAHHSQMWDVIHYMTHLHLNIRSGKIVVVQLDGGCHISATSLRQSLRHKRGRMVHSGYPSQNTLKRSRHSTEKHRCFTYSGHSLCIVSFICCSWYGQDKHNVKMHQWPKRAIKIW